MAGIMMMHMSHKRTTSGGAGSMRSLLSVSGQTAYDAASNDTWFNVSSADYAAVFSGLSGTTKVGMNDATLGGGGTAFSGNFGSTLTQANVTVASGNYIIGFATKSSAAATANTNVYYSTTFKGTYSTIGTGGIALPNSGSIVYFLRKAPASAQGSTCYVALGTRTSGNWWATGTWAGGGYSASLTSGSWTNYTASLPCQQWLISTTNP